MNEFAALRWPADGLLPVAIVDDRTNVLLTIAYANAEALQRTVASHSTWLFSRSRNELWHKGATSGNTQHVVAVSVDCDADALQYRVIPHGAACHTGADSCFGAPLRLEPATAGGAAFAASMGTLAATIAARQAEPSADSYTARLFAGGVDRIGKKIGEEATEVVIAAKNADRGELIWETADLLYHLLVLLAQRAIGLDEVGDELARRAAPKG